MAQTGEMQRADEVSYPIGAVAARLGVAPETLRSWGTRYGLTPSAKTAGGHRRYTATDVARLARMQRLVSEGATPARAAAAVRSPDALDDEPGDTLADASAPADLPPAGRTRGGPGGRVLAVPGVSREARGIARAASRLDGAAVADRIRAMLVERGAVATWEEALLPVLVAVGNRWARAGEGIDVEHVLSETIVDELRAHRRRQPAAAPARPVLLASYPDDLHSLPLHVLSAALAEVKVAHLLLGARVPLPALAAATRRTGARAVFIWKQLDEPTDPAGAALLAALPRTRPAVRTVLGGIGWHRADTPAEAAFADTLPAAVALLRADR